MALVGEVHNILTSAKAIADRVPSAVPAVQELVQSVKKIQAAITQSMPMAEPPAPPV